jgi:threonylcarbamoyladenosine tRNA methylthiotransferase MtaB
MSRLRLSSLEPWDLDASFFELFADPRLLPHLHLPLQSGCDATLRRMARRTSRSAFASLVGAAREAVRDLAVSTDVMVGFPGETDAEFERSIDFVEELAFSRLHVFRFSPREGTLAATMPDHVPRHLSENRSRRMHELGARLERRFHQALVGRCMPVLWETSEALDGGLRWSGLTGNYARVLAWSDPRAEFANRVVPASIERTVPGAVLARFADEPLGSCAPCNRSGTLEGA